MHFILKRNGYKPMIRILIVDDSDTETALIKHIIEPESDMIVVGNARNGREGVELAAQLKPDLITMDIEMPIMNGLEATRIIVEQNPTPIVVISSTVSDESVKATFHILEAGALTALAKPSNILAASFEETRQRIVDTLRSMATIKVVKRGFPTIQVPQPSKITFIKSQFRNYELVAVGTSVGGPLALKTIFSKLPPNFPLPIIVVQHMSFGFISGFTKWLNESTALPVKDATNLQELEKGSIYVAPDGVHLEIDRVQDKLISRLVSGDQVSGFCPSITVMLKSVARICGANAIGILLTGMGNDGAQGLMELKNAHGHTLIQDPESSVVFGIAAVAKAMGAVDRELKLDEFANYLIEITELQGSLG